MGFPLPGEGNITVKHAAARCVRSARTHGKHYAVSGMLINAEIAALSFICYHNVSTAADLWVHFKLKTLQMDSGLTVPDQFSVSHAGFSSISLRLSRIST